MKNVIVGNKIYVSLFLCSDAREQQTSTPPPPPPFMYLMKYEVPVVLFLLQLKYQGNANSIFNESPVPLLCFVAATFFYWLTVGAMKHMITLSRKWIPALIHVACASVLVSAVSLISIFLPYPISLLPVAVLISYPVALALLFVFPLVLEYVVKKIHDLSVWARGACTSTMERICCQEDT